MEPKIKKQLEPSPLRTPFKKIAMALSGGGFRAASYSIGAMSYLHRVTYTDEQDIDRCLLDNVEFISSASGGTFAGILYSAYTRKGLPFEKVYKDLLTFMHGQDLLEEVLLVLNDDKEWEDEKSRNLINAFAKIYDRKLFRGEVFGVYWGEGIDPADVKAVAVDVKAGHAKAGRKMAGAGRSVEVCFNATEFYRGLSFRWQTDGRPFAGHYSDEGKTGNQYIYIDKETNRDAFETLKRIRLGDIMAASSCFPAGFEPMVYPRDFSYAGLDSEVLQQAMVITDYYGDARALDVSIGMIDGGVDDNQGLYSAMLADVRRRKYDDADGFDLVMVTDVASYFMDPYIPPDEDIRGDMRKKTISDMAKGWGRIWRGTNRALGLAGAGFGVMLMAAILLLVFAGNLSLYNLGLLLLSPAILGLLLVIFVTGYKMGHPLFRKLSGWLGATEAVWLRELKEQVPAISNLSDKSLLSLLKLLKGTKLSVLEQMLKARINSMLSLVLDVNLKQTRRLIFDIFYGNFYGMEVWNNRRVFNVVYELSLLNVSSRTDTITEQFSLGKYPLPGPIAPGRRGEEEDRWAEECQHLLLDNCMQLNAVAEQARTMGTTLWYDATDANSQRMRKVVACGQFTTCVKLLEYVLIVERILQQEAGLPMEQRTIQFDEAALAVLQQVRRQLEADWQQFKEEPYFLYDALK